tara:strand:+ start:1640 stop:1909 length:270 start_codon:yes stop_codon:yes gene_type:complete
MSEREPGNFKYRTNKEIRRKIDKILHDTVIMFANLGTNTPLDVGTKEEAKRLEIGMLDKIKDIDEDFYHDRLKIQRSEEKNETVQEQES